MCLSVFPKPFHSKIIFIKKIELSKKSFCVLFYELVTTIFFQMKLLFLKWDKLVKITNNLEYLRYCKENKFILIFKQHNTNALLVFEKRTIFHASLHSFTYRIQAKLERSSNIFSTAWVKKMRKPLSAHAVLLVPIANLLKPLLDKHRGIFHTVKP